MTIAGFPDQIEVVIGAGWIDAVVFFAEDDTIILDKVDEQGRYSEDGTLVVNQTTNRLLIRFQGGNYGATYTYATVTIWAPTTSVYTNTFTMACKMLERDIPPGGTGNGGDGIYDFRELWSLTNVSAGGANGKGQIPAGQLYNPAVFKSMQAYSIPTTPPTTLKKLIAKGVIIGG